MVSTRLGAPYRALDPHHPSAPQAPCLYVVTNSLSLDSTVGMKPNTKTLSAETHSPPSSWDRGYSSSGEQLWLQLSTAGHTFPSSYSPSQDTSQNPEPPPSPLRRPSGSPGFAVLKLWAMGNLSGQLWTCLLISVRLEDTLLRQEAHTCLTEPMPAELG